MILIIGTYSDPHVAAVVKYIEQAKIDYIILDRFNFDAKTGSIITEITENATLHIGSGTALDKPSSIWWRQKPPFVVPSEKVSDFYDCTFASQEWIHVIRFLELKLENIFSINNPHNSARANNKFYQLQQAKSVGFKIPRTLVTNDYNVVNKFIDEVSPCKVVFKTMNAYMNPSGRLTYTTVITKKLVLAKKSAISIAPGIYQESVKKQSELRVTVVGDNIFTAKINATSNKENIVDWRRDIFDDIYETYTPPESFIKRLLALHKLLGLIYGAYDFILDENGEYIFLEVNPVGQWLWIEKKLGFPISECIAHTLITGAY